MATGIEGLIAEALFKHAETLSFAQPTDIVMPGVVFTPNPEKPYARVEHSPNTVINRSTGTGSSVYRGFLQIAFYWPKGAGRIKPLDSASVVQAHFDKGTVLKEGDVVVKINSRPSVGGFGDEGDRHTLPVTVEYFSSNS
jgi:hypothetical protein